MMRGNSYTYRSMRCLKTAALAFAASGPADSLHARKACSAIPKDPYQTALPAAQAGAGDPDTNSAINALTVRRNSRTSAINALRAEEPEEDTGDIG